MQITDLCSSPFQGLCQHRRTDIAFRLLCTEQCGKGDGKQLVVHGFCIFIKRRQMFKVIQEALFCFTQRQELTIKISLPVPVKEQHGIGILRIDMNTCAHHFAQAVFNDCFSFRTQRSLMVS